MTLFKLKAPQLSELPYLRHFTVISLLSVLVLNISVLEFGFDNSLLSLAQVMDSFDKDFGMYHGKSHHKLDPVKLSFLGSLGQPFRAGCIVFALLIGEKFGRWWVFVVMQIGCLVGVCVLYSASAFPQLLLGRIILQVFVGWHDWLIPMYMAEMVPGPVRGTTIAIYMGASYLGSFVASIVAFVSTRHWEDSRQYKIPFAFMFIFPAICLALTFVMPESPRWLVRKNRMNEAVRALHRLNGSKSNYSPEEEANLLKETIDNDVKTKGSWRDILKGTNKRRTLTTLGCISLVQCTGQAFVTKYGTIFVKGLGTFDPMEFGLLERGLGIIGPLIVAFTVDRFGRRPVFFAASFPYVACLFVIGGLGMIGTEPAKIAIIALYIVAAISHIISFHGVCMMVAAEIPHLTLRDKTLTIAYICSFIFEFGVGFSLPYLLYAPYADLESKVGFIYGSVAVVGIIFAWFYMPETRQRSLEELEELWTERVPAWRFAKYSTHSGVGLRISQLERHAGNGELSDMSEEELKGVAVYHEEIVAPDKEKA